MNEYYIQKKLWLENSEQKGKSLEQIYEHANERQLKLIEKCFEACIKVLEENGQLNKDDNRFIIQLNENFYSINISTPEDMKNLRNKLCTLLEKKPLYISDGGVKSKERAYYKIQNQFMGQSDRIDDVNRVTILSDDYELVQNFMNKFNSLFKERDLSPKKEWTMQSDGLLSKSNDVLIDGYPAEVHINETGQHILSQAITHKVYEVLRLSENDANFTKCYEDLPLNAVKSSIKQAKNMSPKQKILTYHLLKDLYKVVRKNRHKNNFNKRESLMEYHRRAHQIFMCIADKKWIDIYCAAMENYNKKNRENNLEELQIEPLLKKRYKNTDKRFGFLKSMWYIKIKKGENYGR